jgi:hypothetical protein
MNENTGKKKKKKAGTLPCYALRDGGQPLPPAQPSAPAITFGKSGVSPQSIGGDGQTSADKKSLRQTLGADAPYRYNTLGASR